ncbi:X2-like carbohydrate binding domain-containing protein [Paenibacillus sp. UNC451MF]|uniref:X2-like carbohydrate binding domain-containing protein n=1 Tax=Paenibacillus sp. UNC451MF TaxID=1449063 RepID=UPI00048C131F|nr:X2-like carbohydrate binding domain-containing protein [Paenibacillus sp. UNC451MF]
MRKLLFAIILIVMIACPLLQPAEADAASTMFTSVSSQLSTTLALDAGGHIWAWGSNSSGQFGDGTWNSSSTPKRITVTDSGTEVLFKEVKASFNTALALDRDGNLWSAGTDGQGQLGLGATVSSAPVWTKISVTEAGLPILFKKVAVSRYSAAAIDQDGKLWVWGLRTNGAGNYYNPTRQPVSRGGIPVTFETLEMNDENGIAIDSMNNVWNIMFQLINPSMFIVQDGGVDVKFKTIAAGSTYGTGYYFNTAIDMNGNIWTWGWEAVSYEGQLGDGQLMGASVPAVSAPAKISVSDNGSPVHFERIAAGKKHVLALDDNGNMWTWGRNTAGQLGDNSTVNTNVPHKVPITDNGASVQFSDLWAGYDVSYGLDANGRLWSWGTQGLLGDNTSGGGMQKVPKRVYITSQASLTASVTASTYLQPVTLTASIVGALDTPTGAVEFKDGAAVLGSGTVAADGTAQFSASTLQTGIHSITAQYKGDDIYLAHISGAVNITVSMPAAPFITITPSVTANTYGPVTLTVATQTYGSGNSLTGLKWLPGNNNAAAFVSAGNYIQASSSFEAVNNGTYTVYAKDLAGNATVQTIQITNINSALNPATASFDKYAASAGNADVTTALTLNGSTLSSIANGAASLVAGTDYMISGSTVTISKSYLQNQPLGTITLTFTFSGGASQTLAIAITDTTPANSGINPTTANFDKYSGSPGNTDVTTALTLSGNTLTGIANGAASLVAGTDYMVSGNTVTISKSYLQKQPVGPTVLSFTFSGGASQTLAIAITDTTPTNSGINPTTANFDKYAGSSGNTNVTTALTLNGNTLTNIANGTASLVAGTDYTVSGSTVMILKSYLQTQPAGPISLTFAFSGGADQTLTVTVTDSTPGSSAISPTTATFDKFLYRVENADVVTTLTLNGNTLTNITNGASPLVAGTDYTVTDDTVMILKSYLQAQSVGSINLTFAFSEGAVQTLAITITDSTPRRNNSSSSSSGSEPAAETEQFAIVVDPSIGVVINVDSSALVMETATDGTSVQKLALPEHILNQAAEHLKDSTKAIIIIKVADTERSMQVQLSGASVAAIASAFPGADIEVELRGSSLQLKASVIDLEGIAKRLGVAVSDLKIITTMEQVSDSVQTELERLGTSARFRLAGSVVDFHVRVETVSGQSVEIRDLGGTYMVRAIVYDASHATGNVIAVHYDPLANTVSYIPTHLATRDDGKKEAVMKVPHYSIYAVIDTEDRSFADLNGHWAKQDVELLASKLIVNGVTTDRFVPDDSITRAEFASLLVRAMGLSMEHDAAYNGFADVTGTAWYAPAVETAVKAGLVNGVTADRFEPTARITREQMAVMIIRSFALVSGKLNLPGNSQSFAAFADRESISSWAQSAVAGSVEAGIIAGMDGGRFEPQQFATRAQAATMLKRLLQKADFIE